jgi:DNA-binding transcriptional ArsR family regulator
MKFSKEYLEKLAESMSVGEMADHLSMAKSTLYYHMRKLVVERRSRSDAQRLHID